MSVDMVITKDFVIDCESYSKKNGKIGVFFVSRKELRENWLNVYRNEVDQLIEALKTFKSQFIDKPSERLCVLIETEEENAQR